MNTISIEHGNVKMVAHRGASVLEPENSCASFLAAGNRSYFGIETDVHITADGKIVVMHDDNALRTTGTDMVLEQSKFDDIRSLRLLPRPGEPERADLVVPNLEEYIAICRRYEKKCVLELKNPMPESAIVTIVQTIRSLDYLENVIFISFALENLQTIRKLLPGHPVQYLTGKQWLGREKELLQVLVEEKMDLDAYWKFVTPEVVRQCHQNGIAVNVWTVDEPEAARQLVEMGVDFITSNILE